MLESWVGIAILAIYLLGTPLYIPLWQFKGHRSMSDLRFLHFLGHLAGAAFVAHEYMLAQLIKNPATYVVQCFAWTFIYLAVFRKVYVVMKHSQHFDYFWAKIAFCALLIFLLACGATTVAFSAEKEHDKVQSAAYGYVAVGFLAAISLTIVTYFGSSAVHSHRALFSRHTKAALYTDLIVAFLLPAYTLTKRQLAGADGNTKLTDEAIIAALFCETTLFTTQFALHVYTTWEQSKEIDGGGGSRTSSFMDSGQSPGGEGLSDPLVQRGSIGSNQGGGGGGNTNINISHISPPLQGNRSRAESLGESNFLGGNAIHSMGMITTTSTNINVDVVTDSEARNDMQREHVKARRPFVNAINSQTSNRSSISPNNQNTATSAANVTNNNNVSSAANNSSNNNSSNQYSFSNTFYEELKEILMKECSNNETSVAKRLVESRDPKEKGWTLIHHAAARRSVEALKVIWELYKEVASDRVAFSVVDSNGLTPLHLAVLGVEDRPSVSSCFGGNYTATFLAASSSSSAAGATAPSPSSSSNASGSSPSNNATTQQQKNKNINVASSSGSNNNSASNSHTNFLNLVNSSSGSNAKNQLFDYFQNYSNNQNNNNNVTATNTFIGATNESEINAACATISFLCNIVKVDIGAIAGHGDGRSALHFAVMRNSDVSIIRELVQGKASVVTVAERYAAAGSSVPNSPISASMSTPSFSSGGAPGAVDSMPTNPWFHHFVGQLDYNNKSSLVMGIENNNWPAVNVMLNANVGLLSNTTASSLRGGLPPLPHAASAAASQFPTMSGGLSGSGTATSATAAAAAATSTSCGICNPRPQHNSPSALRCGRCRNAPLLHIALVTGASAVARGMLRGAQDYAETNLSELTSLANSYTGSPTTGTTTTGGNKSTPQFKFISLEKEKDNTTTSSPGNINKSSNSAGGSSPSSLNQQNTAAIAAIASSQQQQLLLSCSHHTCNITNAPPVWSRAIYKSLRETTWSTKSSKGLNIFHCLAMGDICPSLLFDIVKAFCPASSSPGENALHEYLSKLQIWKELTSSANRVGGDGYASGAWSHLWEQRFVRSHDGPYRCARHITNVTRASIEFLKFHAPKLIGRIGNAALTSTAAVEITDASEKYKAMELGQFVTEWHVAEKIQQSVPADSKDIILWSIQMQKLRQAAFGAAPSVATMLALNNSSSNSGNINLNDDNLNASSGSNSGNTATASSLPGNTTTTTSGNTTTTTSNTLSNAVSGVSASISSAATALQKNITSVAGGGGGNKDSNKNTTHSSSSSGVAHHHQSGAHSTSLLSTQSAAAVGGNNINAWLNTVPAERRKAVEHLGKVLSIADCLDFLVGAKIGQIPPSSTTPTNASGSPTAIGGGGNNVSNQPNFVRSTSIPCDLHASSTSPPLNMKEKSSSNNNNVNDDDHQILGDTATTQISIPPPEKDPESIIQLRQMLHVRASYFGIRNTDVDPLLTPMEIAYHRCHFPMFLSLIILGEVIDRLFPNIMGDGPASPRLASASLRESSVFSIEPLRREILEQCAMIDPDS